MRLDKFIQDKFNLSSRTYSENLILKGQVKVNGRTVLKPAFSVYGDENVEIYEGQKFASQGADKLEEAFRQFPTLNVLNKNCIDLGCSNGGFTDVLLRRGASKIVAVDVGKCCLPENILSDCRVKFLRANARDLPNELYGTVDVLTADLSFISLTLILPEIFKVLCDGGEALTLIKPQFELTKSALSKNGIVLKEKDRNYAVKSVSDCAKSLGFNVLGIAPSPVVYENKNREYLLYLKK